VYSITSSPERQRTQRVDGIPRVPYDSTRRNFRKGNHITLSAGYMRHPLFFSGWCRVFTQ